jgi:hypothetical protein
MKVIGPEWLEASPVATHGGPEQMARIAAACRGEVARSSLRRRRKRRRELRRQVRELRALIAPPRGPVRSTPRVGARRRGAGRPRGASRSCARSGDSGSSDGSGSGDPEPPAALAGSRAGRGVPARMADGRAGL